MESVIVALDVTNLVAAKQIIQQLDSQDKPTIKVGMELFYAAGVEVITWLQQQGYPIFLDLKLHDIPNTVEKAAFQLGKLNVQYLTVHALGGQTMMTAAVNGLAAGARQAGIEPPKLLAVTELTSISPAMLVNEQHVSLSMDKQVVSLAQLAAKSGAAGVICSPQEVVALRMALPASFLLVTPGIRPAGSATGDQQRVMTPAQAAQAGSSAIVVGRPITQASNPAFAYRQIVKEWTSHE
ncbi:orotidine-5'-phosphate decarboxylase [Furfurilactobacillus curtus]|uniref:Orotidine 5'-phosphate decarboxylase n=1 Tax=Furfurilactobacillus curtus TaxID=1746200 RepID=A0ABQ5JSB5_9LACO